MSEYEVEQKEGDRTVVLVDRRRINGRVRSYVQPEQTVIIQTPRYLRYTFPTLAPTRPDPNPVNGTDLQREIDLETEHEKQEIQPLISSYLKSVLMEMGLNANESTPQMEELSARVFELLDEYRSELMLMD